ncbi:flagellar basal-body rod protein FlgF [uncultured Candidatus Kuenenia sp.]|uniref:flagellar basal-body rod protein FlgF n=1 Tax=uncultured Candidatus Kuenenia sp. TaxID=1048336 RepID=UPI00031BD59B|nr:flagellar basal-body rod protein FlgF [uncultured Candidatus Kuenenia sp.]
MISGLYTGATNMMGQGEYQAVIARNLANVNTVGYKKNIAVFESFVAGAKNQTKEASEGTGSTLGKVATDFSPGVMQFTGNELDLAIKGDGFFEVQTKAGIAYTRSGQFMLSRDRTVVTPEGWPLMSSGGPIQIPAKAQSFTFKTDGSVSVDGKTISKLNIVNFLNPDGLKSIGGSAYIASDKANPTTANGTVEIAQGYLEKSNVNVIDEMVNMIANMRSFQSGNKSTDSINDSLKKLIGLVS